MDKSAKHILETTVSMIEGQMELEKLTVRNIAKEAEVSVGAINYHFSSKEVLLRDAAEIVLAQGVNKYKAYLSETTMEPERQLKQFILGLTDVFLRYRQVARLYLSSEFNQGKFGSVNYILPKMREIYKQSISENEIIVKAIQIVIPMQYIFLHEEGFLNNLNYNFNQVNHDDIKEMIGLMVDNILGD